MKAEEHFQRLGFNALRSEVYVALLKTDPQTAYRTGKLIGRPTANVYKAVEVLLSRGAVTIEEGFDKQVCHAVPVRTGKTTSVAIQRLADDAGGTAGAHKAWKGC